MTEPELRLQSKDHSDQFLKPHEIISKAIQEHKPVRVFACFSSGNDSIVSTHVAMQLKLAHEVFNINTGIAIPQARQHLYEVCDRFNWPLRIKTPPDLNYEEMVLRDGFPSRGAHIYPYVWLKERAIDALVRETKRSQFDRVMLITGVRASESAHRMGYVEPIVRSGCTVWVAPIFAWSVKERDAYMDQHSLPRSPVSDLIHISGECLCGAYAHDGERKEIALWYPDVDKRLSALEKTAEDAGLDFCKWGAKRPRDKRQQEMFMPMCAGCSIVEAEGVKAS